MSDLHLWAELPLSHSLLPPASPFLAPFVFFHGDSLVSLFLLLLDYENLNDTRLVEVQEIRMEEESNLWRLVGSIAEELLEV